MFPCQASWPLRWLLRPNHQVYAVRKHSMTLSGFLTSAQCKHNSSAPMISSTPSVAPKPNESTLTPNANPSRMTHTVRPFFTSCQARDAARNMDDEELKALKLENGEKVKAILSCGSFEELATMAQKVDSGFLACVVLQRLSSLVKEGKTPAADGETLLQHGVMKSVCKLIDNNVARLSPKAVLNTLQALYEMTTTDVYIVKSLATQMLWLLRRLPLPLVIQTLQLHLRYHGNDKQGAPVVQQCLDILQRRWVELTNPRDIIYLMYVTQSASPLSQVLLDRLEDRALDIVEKASPKELYRVIYLLCRQRHRNTPLIRAVVYHLNKGSLSSLSPVQLTNLVYALCTLSIFDSPLLTKVCAELKSKQGDITPNLASSLMTSFSRLRWKEESMLSVLMNVLEGKATAKGKEMQASSQKSPVFVADSPPVADSAISPSLAYSASSPSSSSATSSSALKHDADSIESRQVCANLSSLDVADKAGVVLSLANLGVDTWQSRALVREIIGQADVQGLRESSPLVWLDVVWSLCVLQMADSAAVTSVLSKDFWGKLCELEDSFQSLVQLTKVSNINCAARFELESYTGPLLPHTTTTPDAKLFQKGERKAAERLVGALTNMAPKDSYTLTNTTAAGGYLLDAEFYVDSFGNPKPLSQASDNSSDIHRVAFKVLDFPDLTLPTSDLTGLHVMAARHLHCQGYSVVQVKHSEMPAQSKVVEMVNFLQQKIKDAVMVKDTLKVKNSLKVKDTSKVNSGSQIEEH